MTNHSNHCCSHISRCTLLCSAASEYWLTSADCRELKAVDIKRVTDIQAQADEMAKVSPARPLAK